MIASQLAAIERQIAALGEGEPPDDDLLERLTVVLRDAADDNLLRTQRLVDNASASVTAAVGELRESWPDVAAALAPLHDRLAAIEPGPQLDGLAHRVEQLREQLDELATSQPATADVLVGLVQAGEATQTRIESLGSAIHAMHESRPDITSSLQTIASLLDALRSYDTETRAELERLSQHVTASASPMTDEVRSLVLSLGDRIDALPQPAELDLTPVLQRLDAIPEPSTIDLTPALDRLAEQVARIGQQQLTDADRLSASLDERSEQDANVQGLASRVEQLAATLAAKPTSDPGIDRLTGQLEQLRSLVTALADRSTVERALAEVEGVRTLVADLVARPTADPSVNRLGERIEQLAADLANAIASQPATLTGPVEQLAQQVESVRALVAQVADTPSTAPALEALTARLDEVAAAVTAVKPPDRNIERITTAVGELQTRLDAVAAAIAEPADDETGREILTRLDAVEEVRTGIALLLERPAADPAVEALGRDVTQRLDELAEAVTAEIPPDPGVEHMARALDQIRAAIAAIGERPTGEETLGALAGDVEAVRRRIDEVAAIVTEEAPPDPAVERITGTLDHVRTVVAALAERPTAEPALERIGAQVAELRTLVASVANRPQSDPAVAELRDDLAARLDRVASALADRPETDPTTEQIAAQLDHVRAIVTAIADRPETDPTTEQIAAQLDHVRAIVTAIADRPTTDPTTEQLAAQLDHVRAIVTAIVDRPTTDPAIERIAAEVSALADRPTADPNVERVAVQVDQVRAAIAALDARPTTDPNVERVAAQVEHLQAMLTAIAERPTADPNVERLAAELSELRPAIAELDALARVAADRPSAAPAIDALVERLDTLRDAIAELGRRPTTDPAIEALGRTLAQQIDGVVAATAPAVEGLAQVVETNAATVDAGLRELLARTQRRSEDDSDVAARLERLHDGLRRAIADVAVAAQQFDTDLDQLRAAVVQATTPRDDEREALDERLAGFETGMRSVLAAFGDRAEQLTDDLQRAAAESSSAAEERLTARVVTEIEQVRTVVEGLTSDTAALRASLDSSLGAVQQTIAAHEPPPPSLDRTDVEAAVAGAVRAVDARLAQLAEAIAGLGTDAESSRFELDAHLAALREAVTEPAPPGLQRADVDDAVAASATSIVGTIVTRLDRLQEELARLDQQNELARLADGLAALREHVEATTAPADQLQAAVTAAVAGVADRLDELARQVQRQTDQDLSGREDLAATLDRMAGRVDADANRVLDVVTAGDEQLRIDVSSVEAGLAAVRRELEKVGELVDAVDGLRAATTEPAPTGGGDITVNAIAELVREVVATREELGNVGRNVGGMRADLKHAEEEMTAGGAAAALIASAAAAMGRLEGRLEHEFDVVSEQLESLGDLVHNAIESVEALEMRFAGELAPETERLRDTAASTRESMRTSRQRRTVPSGPRSLEPGE